MTVTVSTPWILMGCSACGVVAPSRGRRLRVLNDVPHGEVRIQLAWRLWTWRCPDPGCAKGTFTDPAPSLVAARGSITTRAIKWAIGQLRREHATILGLAHRLGAAWKTLWRAVRPELQRLAADQARFEGVRSLGVDEHIWHYVNPRKQGPKELTGMVDLIRGAKGRVRARLLDLIRK